MIALGARAPLGGELIVGVIGHSIASGYNAAGSSTVYPAGVDLTEDGVDQSAWTDTPAGAPNRGIMHAFGTDSIAAGYTSCTFYRRGTPGIALSTMMATNWPALVGDLAVAGKVPDVLIVEIGENDAQAGESAAFAARFAGDLAKMRTAYPHARILVAEPVTTDLGAYPEIVAVTTGITDAIAATTGAYLIPNTGVTHTDTVHPDADGHDVAGAAAAALYLAS